MMNNINAELERMDFLMRYTTMMLEGIQSSDLTNEQMLDLLYRQYIQTITLLEIREKKDMLKFYFKYSNITYIREILINAGYIKRLEKIQLINSKVKK